MTIEPARTFTIGDWCDECPLHSEDDVGNCTCDADDDKRMVGIRPSAYSSQWTENIYPRPDWCQLRKGGVFVVESTEPRP